MKGTKNDFSITFYDGEEKRLFMEFVHDTAKAVQWVDSRSIVWTHAMIYNRRTREKVDRILNQTEIKNPGNIF